MSAKYPLCYHKISKFSIININTKISKMSRKITDTQDDKELLQQSLKRLQRQYRTMERDKNSYASEIKCCLQRQRKMVATLTKEEANLLYRLETDKTRQSYSEREQNFLALTVTHGKYQMLIKKKREKIGKLNQEIVDLKSEKRVLAYYNDSKTIKMDERIVKSTNQVHRLQDQLYNETVKHDKLIAYNARTRQAVDSLLKDRSKFNELYQKLQTKLNADKKKLLSLINRASLACEQRDETDEKLKSTLHKEEQQCIAEKHNMRELHRQLDHLINLNKFLSIKAQKRLLVDLEEEDMKKRQEKNEEIESHTQRQIAILEQLKQFCDEPNVERLPDLFSKREEENFALFNYVNEVSNEVENLRNEVQTLRTSLEKEKKLTSVIDRKEQIKSLNDIETELQGKRNAIEKMRKGIASITQTRVLILNEIWNKFSLVKQTSPALVHLIGEEVVTSENVDLFLDIIAKKMTHSTFQEDA